MSSDGVVRGDRLDQVVAWWARRTPDATAVEQHGHGIGYAELVDRADAVADTLLRQGIRPGDVVATALDRSVDLVVALVGVLRANATAVVLDPAWPSWRIEDVVDLLAVRAVVGADVQLTANTAGEAESSGCIVFPPGARPSGVLVPHREIVAEAGSRSVRASPLGSEGFLHEVSAALLNGGCLVLSDEVRHPEVDSTELIRVGDRWIDPEEVEATLMADHRIAACVVFPFDDALACAYTTHDGQPLPLAVPHRLHLASLPLVATLRVSYESLCAQLRRRVDGEPVDPLLAEVRGLLGGAALEPDDDLLDAGMTSLDAVRIATALSARTGQKITVGDIYRHRRLSTLAHGSPPGGSPVFTPPHRYDTSAADDHRPLAHAQKRFLFAEAFSPGSADNLIVESYELNGPLEPEVLRAALQDVVDRHHALRTVYAWERGQPVQHLLEAELLPWSEVPPPDDHARLSSEAVARRVAADWWDTPFRLDKELPIRARLCRTGTDRAVLCLQFHHIAFDGLSELPFLADLRHAYEARSRGEAPEFPPAPGYLSLGRAEEHQLPSWATTDIPYWRDTLADCPPPCLPVPAKGSDNEAHAAETVRRLDPATVRLLIQAAVRCAGPPLSALSAGAALALARRFDRDDVCVGTLTAGRFDADTDEVVGYLVNPFAVPLHGLRRSAGQVLAEAARQVVDGLEHARTPFDELVRELRPGRDRHPWFEAWVILQHPPGADVLGPVALRALRVPPPRTSRSWMVEAFPDAEGGWELVTTWREDVMDDETAEALADDLVKALVEIGGAHE